MRLPLSECKYSIVYKFKEKKTQCIKKPFISERYFIKCLSEVGTF